MSDSFSREESFAHVLKIVLETDFSSDEIKLGNTSATIVYQDDIPFLRFQAQVKNELGECVCYYRLDKMLALVFSECEATCRDAHERGYFGICDEIALQRTVRHVARYAMNMMLRRLMLLQLAMFQENFDDTMFLTVGILLRGISRAFQEHENSELINQEANAGIRTLLEKTIEMATKRKRDF